MEIFGWIFMPADRKLKVGTPNLGAGAKEPDSGSIGIETRESIVSKTRFFTQRGN